MFSNVLRDMRYAVRQLMANPAFTIVAILTLALGIGATTAIFSVVNGVLLRPLPFPNPDSLVLVYEVVPSTDVFPWHPLTSSIGAVRTPCSSESPPSITAVRRSPKAGTPSGSRALPSRGISSSCSRLRRRLDAAFARMRMRLERTTSSCSAMGCGSADSAAIRTCSADRSRSAAYRVDRRCHAAGLLLPHSRRRVLATDRAQPGESHAWRTLSGSDCACEVRHHR